MEKVRLVALDLDGTLISCAPRQMTVLQAEANRAGVHVDLSELWERKRAGSSTLQALCEAGLPEYKAQSLTTRWRQRVEEPVWLALDSCFSDTQVTLSRAKSDGIHLVLLTGRTNPTWLPSQLHRLGISRFFDSVEIVSPCNAEKEKAQILLQYMPMLYVGDTEVDLCAAARVEIPFIALDRGQRSRSFLAKRGAMRIDANLTEAFEDLQN